MSLLDTVRFLFRHPLNTDRKLAALSRFLSWQAASRLISGTIVVPFVNGTRLLVGRGMTGATGNVYAGLHDFEEIGLLLHVLRPGDLFVDVGANVGSYTIAACAVNARVIALEPVPDTFEQLTDNVRLNRFEPFVDLRNVAAGPVSGTSLFTTTKGVCNHVVDRNGDSAGAIPVPVATLDETLSGCSPVAIKIDVEGFEANVLDGAAETLARDSVLVVVLELNTSGLRYGSDDNAVHLRMQNAGFVACSYRPLQRKLAEVPTFGRSGNTLYVRDVAAVQQRVDTSAPFSVLRRNI